jgi:flagellar biosynthesis/type III secretory pathway M-ring protein FliF/YscJ
MALEVEAHVEDTLTMRLRARSAGQAGFMSTTAIVILVVAAVILLAVIAYIASRPKRQLKEQRELAASRHSERADAARAEAARAEEQARIARTRAESHAERAEAYREGEADDDLERDPVASERDVELGDRDGRFARDDGRSTHFEDDLQSRRGL